MNEFVQVEQYKTVSFKSLFGGQAIHRLQLIEQFHGGIDFMFCGLASKGDFDGQLNLAAGRIGFTLESCSKYRRFAVDEVTVEQSQCLCGLCRDESNRARGIRVSEVECRQQ